MELAKNWDTTCSQGVVLESHSRFVLALGSKAAGFYGVLPLCWPLT